MSRNFDPISFAIGKASGGGGGNVDVEALSVDLNGTYNAPSGKAYSPVSVDVPNSYAAGDEGKVVSNGALVAQTAHETVTTNGTIDTTLNNSVEVSVSGGGGSSNVVTGTFTGTTTGEVLDVPLNYSGTGYPIAVFIFPTEGPYNNAAGTFYSLLKKYAVASFFALKQKTTEAPSYRGIANDMYNYQTVFKKSDTDSSAYNFSCGVGSSGAYIARNESPAAGAGTCVRIKSATSMSVMIEGSLHSFAANIEYTYYVIYSE